MFIKTDLKYFNEIKFDTNYVFNISHLFHHCHSLLAINFSLEWDEKMLLTLALCSPAVFY